MENIVKFLIVSVLLYASHSQAKEYIKIATFNLRLAPPEVAGTLDGENCWNNRKKIAADLVCKVCQNVLLKGALFAILQDGRKAFFRRCCQ